MVRTSGRSPTKFRMNMAAAHVQVETGSNAGEWLIPTSTSANVKANAGGNIVETLRTYVTAIYLGPPGTSKRKIRMKNTVGVLPATIKDFAEKQSQRKK